MAKPNKPAPSTKTPASTPAPAEAAAGATAKGKVAAAAVANPKIVAAFRDVQNAKEEHKSKLVSLAEICQREKATRPELIASYMEARGVERVTAEGQISRMFKMLMDPVTLEDLKSNKIDLKTARERTTTKQTNPSAAKKAENAEKKFARGLTILVEGAKEAGMDKDSCLIAFKAALKKNGIV